MRMIAWNSAAADRSTLLLLFVLAILVHNIDLTDHSLGTTYSFINDTELLYSKVHPENLKFLIDVDTQRAETAQSIIDFKFNENRIRKLTKKTINIPKDNNGIVYWMTRDLRVQDNWALLYAQKLAIENKVPLHVVFSRPSIVVNTRQHKFMLSNVKRIEFECELLNIEFDILIGNLTETLTHFVRNHTLGAIIVDFSPLREDIKILEELVHDIGSEVPVIQIDAHNVVPCWLSASKQLKYARSLRKRTVTRLYEYLTEFPPVIKHPYQACPRARPTNWKNRLSNIQNDISGQTVLYVKPGYVTGMSVLNYFIKTKLARYHIDRLNPTKNGLSNLSPWLHFGHISAQRVALEILKFNCTYPKGVMAYKEEILIRRELSENFCYYNKDYDNFQGGPLWGRLTLNEHRNDTRKHVFTREQFENGLTDDDLWNAAHNQMKMDGKIHRHLRPFWAKTILEFSETPEEAITTANYLNNKYSLDGNDPNGYVGVLWSITGLHDKECTDRTIFGTVRYIETLALTTNFNAHAYIRKYGGQRVDEFYRKDYSRFF